MSKLLEQPMPDHCRATFLDILREIYFGIEDPSNDDPFDVLEAIREMIQGRYPVLITDSEMYYAEELESMEEIEEMESHQH